MTTKLESQHVIPLKLSTIEECLSATGRDQILKGLYRGSFGFLIAPPDTGKSFLCLSIAYELAVLDHGIVGIGYPHEKPLRTLLWPVEDALEGTLPRVKAHLQKFSHSVQDLLQDFVSLYDRNDAICCTGSARNSEEWRRAEQALETLIETAKNYDLVIIDTLREAIGSADEVKDDYLIREVLSRLSKEADVAVLAVHHPTKEISRGKEIINSVAGSGLSSTLSKSKLHLFLDRTDKKGKLGQTRLRHIKANYLPLEDQWREPRSLFWTDTSFLHCDPDVISRLQSEPQDSSKPKAKAAATRRRTRLPKKPQVIERNEDLISNESRKLAEEVSHGPFGGGMASELHTLKKRKP